MYKTIIIMSLMFALCFNFANSKAYAANANDNTNSTETAKTITLNQAQQMALEFNPSLKNIDESIYQAQLIIYKAWSILLPNLSANASLTLNSTESSMSFPDLSDPNAMAILAAGGNVPMAETVMVEKWGKQFGFSANMPLFNAQSIPLIKNAYANIDLTRFEGRHRKNELLFAVTSSYYQIRFAMESVRIAKDNLKNTNEFLRMAKARKEVGSGTIIDVLRAESEVMAVQKNLKNAEDSVNLSKTALAYLSGIEGAYEISELAFAAPVKGNLPTLTKKALANRLDLKVSQIAVQMAKRDKATTWTKWIPNFDLTYNWNYNSATGFSDKHDSWMLIFGLKWSLLEGGRRIIDLKQNNSNIRIQTNNLKQQELDIQAQVEKERIEVAKHVRNVELTRKQLAVMQKVHHQVSRQYEVGLASSLDLLDTQTRLGNMKLSLELEILQYRLAVLSLNKSVGEYNSLLD